MLPSRADSFVRVSHRQAFRNDSCFIISGQPLCLLYLMFPGIDMPEAEAGRVNQVTLQSPNALRVQGESR